MTFLLTPASTKLAQTHEDTEFNTIAKLLSQRVGSSVYLDPPSPIEIFNVINALGSKKAVCSWVKKGCWL